MEKLVENLKKKGYIVSVFDNKESAADYMTANIKNATVGIGGCMTAVEMGLYEKLARDNTIYWHWKATEEMPADVMRDKAATADVYISSVNGIAETGEMINIDGNGNRVAATIYGHKKVYLIIGQNKIAPDFEKAMWRARNIAAPKNSHRLGIVTPCRVKSDKCYDCKSPARICNAFVTFAAKPYGCNEYEVVLIKEDLGY